MVRHQRVIGAAFRQLFLQTAIPLLLVIGTAGGAPPESSVEAFDVETLIEGAKAGRERLVTGEFALTKVVSRAAGATTRIYHVTFDFSTGRFRHEHFAEGKQTSDSGQFISTPEGSLMLSGDRHVLLQRRAGEYGRGRGGPFDIRSLGFVDLQLYFNSSQNNDFSGVSSGGSSAHSLATILRSCDVRTMKGVGYSCDLVTSDGAENIRLRRWKRDIGWFNEIVFSVSSGFAPIEWREWNNRVQWPDADGVPVGDVTDEMIIEYQQLNGVHVPVKARYQSVIGSAPTIELALNWTMVNDKVDSDRFDVKGLSVPESVTVVDQRSGVDQVLGPLRSLRPPGVELKPRRDSSLIRWILFAVNGVAAVAFVVYLIRRRRP